MVFAPKGLSSVFSPWKALDRARRRDVYTGLVPKGLLSLGGILGGGKSQPILCKPAVKLACGTCAAHILPPIKHFVCECLLNLHWAQHQQAVTEVGKHHRGFQSPRAHNQPSPQPSCTPWTSIDHHGNHGSHNRYCGGLCMAPVSDAFICFFWLKEPPAPRNIPPTPSLSLP